jgi:hypothetical protein
MLADQFHAAAAAARNTATVDEIARLTWRAHAEGQIHDADAEAVSEALQARRRAFAAGQGFPRRAAQTAASARPRAAATRPRSPDRQASLERRRRQAMSGIVPAKIAASFTVGELAVLSVIGRQCQRGGACVLPIAALAALAGVSRTTVQNALRAAKAQGLLLVRERRIPGRRSLTNVVTVASPEWRDWLKIGGQGGGFRNLSPTDSHFHSGGKSARIVPREGVNQNAYPASLPAPDRNRRAI